VLLPEGTLEVPTPDGLFFGGDTLWIADPANHTIWSATAPEYVAVPIVTGEDIFGVDGPKDVLWKDNGTQVMQVLASAPGLSAIQTFNTDGVQGITLGSADVLTTPKGMWDWGGGLWVADSGTQKITVLDAAGLLLLEYGGPSDEAGGLVAPEDIALSESGDFIVLADPGGSQVVIYDFDGVVVDTLTGPEGWTPVAVTVSNDGSTVFVLDGATGEISAYGATYASLCASPGAAGDSCGEDGDPPCADGLTCAPAFEGSIANVCKGELAEGASCNVANAVCPEGTECVRGNAASKHEKLCLIQVAIGEACGPGIAGCVSGAGCNFDGPLHLSRTCHADVLEGSVCNGYGTGDCEDGTSCVLQLPGSVVKVCRAFAAEGEGCDVLAGTDCEPGLSCNYNTSIQDRACFSYQPSGAVCGIGAGECEPGSSCQFPTPTALTPICIPNSIIGEECATEGKGLCDDDATCVLSAATGPAFCAENSGEDTEPCGGYGMTPCTAGTECLVDVLGGSTASCYQDIENEDIACGVEFGFCDEAEGLACGITDSDNLTGTCRPHAPDYGACGSLEAGTPGCGLFTHTCTCSNPFLEMTTYDPAVCQAGGYQEVCIPNAELYDFCAVNTVLVGTEADLGWIGLCSNDLVCSGAVGYNFGELVTSNADPVTSLFFQCKPTVGIGEACGQRFACDSGLSCLCGADTPCTIYESMVGDQGVCGIAAP